MTSDLWRRVAAVLSGYPGVEVRFKPPVIKDFDGAAYIHGRRAVIDVRPGLTESQSYFVLLHEAGHLRAGSAGKNIDPGLTPETLKLSDLGRWAYKCHPHNVKIETEADRWRELWSAWADRSYIYHPGLTDIESRLLALLGWVPLDQEINAAEIGVKAATDYLRRLQDVKR